MSNNLYVDIEEKIWKIIDVWRASGMTISDSIRSIIYFLTLKKMIKEPVDDTVAKDFQTILNLHGCMYAFKEGTDENLLFVESPRLIEKKYHLQIGFLGDFFTGVYNLNSWKATLNASLKNIMEIPNVEDEVMSAVITLIMFKGFSMEGYRTAPEVTSSSLSEILKVVLDVQNGDRFFDGTIGCGISALRCVRGTDASIQGMDLNVSSLQIAALYTILSGRKKFEFKAGDFTLEQSKEKYDKIAMDIPFAARTGDYIGEQIIIRDKWLGGAQGRDLDVLMAGKVLEVLEENGRAAIVVPNGFLFRMGKANKNIRETILEKKMLRAVISLPALHFDTFVKSSVLLLEKNDDKVLLINMASEEGGFFQKQRREIPMLTPEGSAKLIDILENEVEVEGVSALVDEQQLRENEFDFSPTRYVSIKENISFRDMRTINNDLKLLYEELKEIEEENSKMRLFN